MLSYINYNKYLNQNRYEHKQLVEKQFVEMQAQFFTAAQM